MAKRICRNLHRAKCFAKHNPPAQKNIFIWCIAIIELFLHEILFLIMSNLIIIAVALLVLFIVWKIAKAIIKWTIIIVIIAVVAYLMLHGGAA